MAKLRIVKAVPGTIRNGRFVANPKRRPRAMKGWAYVRGARNTEGFIDKQGKFHPIRAGEDYDPAYLRDSREYLRGEGRGKKKKTAKRRKR